MPGVKWASPRRPRLAPEPHSTLREETIREPHTKDSSFIRGPASEEPSAGFVSSSPVCCPVLSLVNELP